MIESLRAQTYPDWEAIIVNNYSKDDTVQVVNSFVDPRLRLVNYRNDGVIAASRNEGIRRARGDYVAFLDSDDWWKPQKLEESVKHLEQGADVVYHDLLFVTSPRQRFFWRTARARELKSPVFTDLILNGNGLCNSSVVVRRKHLEAINGLAEERDLIGSEDYDAWLRIAKHTEKFKRIRRTLGYYWVGGGNMTSAERSLRNLDAIEKRYADAIMHLDAGHAIWWLNYAKGKAHFRVGSYAMARASLRLVRWPQAPFSACLKSQWLRLLTSFALWKQRR
jgi:glycosyltransferase involved in cell wall biosynthesis